MWDGIRVKVGSDGGRCEPSGGRRGQQGAVAGDDHKLGVADQMRCRQVHGVVAPQRVLFGKIACPLCKGVIDVDQVDLLATLAEFVNSRTKLLGRDTAEAVGLSKRRSRFGVNDPDADDAVGTIPQSRRGSRAWLLN